MTVLIGPEAPSLDEFNEICRKRDAWARVIARDVIRGFQPDGFDRQVFATLDAAVKTTMKIYKNRQGCAR